MRILNILGQRPAMTGSGVLVRELWRCGVRNGDELGLVCAGYPDDPFESEFGPDCRMISFTQQRAGEIPFAIPGMSDAMPYPARRYADLTPVEFETFLQAFLIATISMQSAFRAEILHIHHLWALTALAEHIPEIPAVVTVHGTGLKLLETAPRYRALVADKVRFIRHFFCVSEDIAEDARREYGIPHDKLSVLGNGYDESVFSVGGAVHALTRPVVLAAGKFVAWKGFSYLIQAAAQLEPAPQLVIAGDGPEAERLQLLGVARELGVDVIFPGHLPQVELARWMRGAAVFVLSSLREPFGLVLLEAMACGCPVVAAASGGPRDLVGKSLLEAGAASLVPPLCFSDSIQEARYVQDLASAIRGHLARSESERESMKPLIAASVSNWTWSQVYRSMRTVYARLIEESNSVCHTRQPPADAT